MNRVTITAVMASPRVDMFLLAKKTIRLHRDWSDKEVAEHLGIPEILIPETIGPARREVEQDG
jgi:hypothetical protein